MWFHLLLGNPVVCLQLREGKESMEEAHTLPMGLGPKILHIAFAYKSLSTLHLSAKGARKCNSCLGSSSYRHVVQLWRMDFGGELTISVTGPTALLIGT